MRQERNLLLAQVRDLERGPAQLSQAESSAVESHATANDETCNEEEPPTDRGWHTNMTITQKAAASGGVIAAGIGGSEQRPLQTVEGGGPAPPAGNSSRLECLMHRS